MTFSTDKCWSAEGDLSTKQILVKQIFQTVFHLFAAKSFQSLHIKNLPVRQETGSFYK